MDRQFGLNRRCFVAASAAVLLAGPALAARDVVEVYKSPTCGCCNKWIEHIRANGFEVRVGGYLVEGHVPARDIQRLLRERPKTAGLAVPGMPRGSPGMDSEVTDPYDVLLFQRSGRYAVYQRYGTR